MGKRGGGGGGNEKEGWSRFAPQFSCKGRKKQASSKKNKKGKTSCSFNQAFLPEHKEPAFELLLDTFSSSFCQELLSLSDFR